MGILDLSDKKYLDLKFLTLNDQCNIKELKIIEEKWDFVKNLKQLKNLETIEIYIKYKDNINLDFSIQTNLKKNYS